jgi:hypothetical protein
MPTANPNVVAIFYLWSREDDEDVILGQVRSHSNGPGGAIFHVTEDRATAKLWARELAAGRVPPPNQ